MNWVWAVKVEQLLGRGRAADGQWGYWTVGNKVGKEVGVGNGIDAWTIDDGSLRWLRAV